MERFKETIDNAVLNMVVGENAEFHTARLERLSTDALFFNIARCAEILCKRGVISAQQTARRPKDVISCTELDIVRMEQKSHPGKTIFVMPNILERVKQ